MIMDGEFALIRSPECRHNPVDLVIEAPTHDNRPIRSASDVCADGFEFCDEHVDDDEVERPADIARRHRLEIDVHVVACGVGTGGFDRLGIEIDTENVAGTERSGREREYATSCPDIEHGHSWFHGPLERFEAEPGCRVAAVAKSVLGIDGDRRSTDGDLVDGRSAPCRGVNGTNRPAESQGLDRGPGVDLGSEPGEKAQARRCLEFGDAVRPEVPQTGHCCLAVLRRDIDRCYPTH